MYLSTNIRQFRKDNGISQEFMAEQLCMSQPSYYRLEKKERICAQRLDQIARALNTTPDTLLTYHIKKLEHLTEKGAHLDPLKALLAEQAAIIQHQSDELCVLRQYLNLPNFGKDSAFLNSDRSCNYKNADDNKVE